MADAATPRVAVYLDFDNIVTSRYDALHGKGSFRDHKIRHMNVSWSSSSPEKVAKATEASVNLAAILDHAASLGTIAIARAYADWAVPVNDSYTKQLNKMSVTPVHLSPSGQGAKNGADIRLTIDVMEDVLGSAELAHVVIVAGDSDFIPLIRRCRELGKTVTGIGVAGSVSESLRDACDRFIPYEELPGVVKKAAAAKHSTAAPRALVAAPETKGAKFVAKEPAHSAASAELQQAATLLMLRSLPPATPGQHADWMPCAALKNAMLTADRTFDERKLGFKNFSAFVISRSLEVEYSTKSNGRARLRPGVEVTA
jgi:uncharacterized LabA/DUF88 family protein